MRNTYVCTVDGILMNYVCASHSYLEHHVQNVQLGT